MANKKITEFDLRSSFTDGCNVPIDDTIQTYRITGSKIMDWIRTYGTLQEWDATVSYAADAVVTKGGRLYRSLTGSSNLNKSPLTQTAYWVGMIDVYSSARTYVDTDWVFYLGEIYKSRANSNLNNTPSTSTANWISLKRYNSLGYVGTNPEVGGSSPFQMVYSDNKVSILNPSGAITVKLPTTGVLSGERFQIRNSSANKITIQSSDATQICVLDSKFAWAEFTALQDTPTAYSVGGTSHWYCDFHYECPISYLADKSSGTNDIAYRGSTKATLSSSPNNISSVYYAVLYPYQLQDGTWRMKFNIGFVLTSGDNSMTFTINSILWKNVSNYRQACSASTDDNSIGCQGRLLPNSATFVLRRTTGNEDKWYASGDGLLDAKPGWAW